MAYSPFLEVAPTPTSRYITKPPVATAAAIAPPAYQPPPTINRPGALVEPPSSPYAPTGDVGAIARGVPPTSPGPPDSPNRGITPSVPSSVPPPSAAAAPAPSPTVPGAQPPANDTSARAADGGDAAATAPPPAASAPDPYDLNQDAGYGRALSQFYASGGQSAADYLAQIEPQLLGFGSLSLAHKTLDGLMPELENYERKAGVLGANDHIDLNPFYQSFYLHDANGNPLTDASGKPIGIDNKDQGLSTLAGLNRGAFEATKGTINANRLGNISYGTAGANDLANTGYNNNLALSNAANTENSNLLGFLTGYHNNLNTAQGTLNTAADSAYNRLVQMALANKTGASSSSGGSSGGQSGGAGGAGSTTAAAEAHAPAVAAASERALQAAQAAGKSPAEAALAARSAGLNAAYGLSQAAPKKKTAAKSTAASALAARSQGLNAFYGL